jgi:hypothetical protein
VCLALRCADSLPSTMVAAERGVHEPPLANGGSAFGKSALRGLLDEARPGRPRCFNAAAKCARECVGAPWGLDPARPHSIVIFALRLKNLSTTFLFLRVIGKSKCLMLEPDIGEKCILCIGCFASPLNPPKLGEQIAHRGCHDLGF